MSLQNELGIWISDQDQLLSMAKQYFSDLFQTDAECTGSFVKGLFPPLTTSQKEDLAKEFRDKEIICALKGMSPSKAPGPDGFNAGFYQKTWSIIGKKVLEFVKGVQQTGHLTPGIADALLVLIPKVENPSSIKEYRPISLCNVIYKLVTKVIANRLKSVWSGLICSNQVSFVAGRQSIDNVIVCKEVIHSINQRKVRKGAMIIKLDMEKAYDRMEWNYVEETMINAGIPRMLVDISMNCIRMGSCRLLWNGEVTEAINPSRGIRQGDPLSPYLFVLCVERLSQWINMQVAKGSWKAIRPSRSGPQISHLFFADDLILFAEAREDQIKLIKSGLESFARASGQKINYAKSNVFFSQNVTEEEAAVLSYKLGIPSTKVLSEYLGFNLNHQGRNKETHMELLRRIEGELAGRKNKCLSKAGRITLVRSVLNAIPVF